MTNRELLKEIAKESGCPGIINHAFIDNGIISIGSTKTIGTTKIELADPMLLEKIQAFVYNIPLSELVQIEIRNI